MLSIARSRLAFPFQLSFLGLHSIATLLGTIYRYATPQLYKSNSHGPTGWIVTWVVVLQSIMSLFRFAVSFQRREGGGFEEPSAFLSMTTEALEQHQQQQETAHPDPHRFSRDSGHFTASEQSRSQSVSSTATYTQDEQQKLHEYEADHENFGHVSEKKSLLDNSKVESAAISIARLVPKQTVRVIDLLHGLIDRTIFLMGFVALVTGVAVYGGVFVSD